MTKYFIESIKIVNKFWDDKIKEYQRKENERDPCEKCEHGECCEIQDSNCCGIDPEDFNK